VLFSFLAALSVAGSSPAVIAQVQPKGPAQPNTSPRQATEVQSAIRFNVELVLANATVTDSTNRPVIGLNKNNFRIFEDGQEQEVAHFSSEDVPISIGVILDMSGSSLSQKVKLHFLTVSTWD
jgi:Ca-activated chloride channel family protein